MKQFNLKSIPRDELAAFVTENLKFLAEEEALAVLENPFISPKIIQMIAQNARVTGFYSVRLKLVASRHTPQAHAVKLVHYLYWPDLVRLSVETTVPPQVRRAIDNVLLSRIDKLT